MKKPLENIGTADAKGDLECKACGYVGSIDTYEPAMSVYHDIVCPQCRSTHNDHNAAYFEQLQAAMRATTP